MIKNLKTSTDQSNEAINNEPVFDTYRFNLSSVTSDPLLVVNFSLRRVNKHRAKTVADITCLWDSIDTNIMINRKNTKNYEHKMYYNKVEYNTAAGVYCTTHDVKVTLCMPEFSSSKTTH